MEELSQNVEKILTRSRKCESEWENEMKEIQLKLEAVLLGAQAPVQQTISNSGPAVVASPQQTKKRAKRLSAVIDDEDEQELVGRLSPSLVASAPSTVVNETVLPEVVQKQEPAEVEHVFARPMRAAKQKIEGLKEPALGTKMRRPDNNNETIKKIKKEKDTSPTRESSRKTTRSNKSQIETVKPQSQSNNESVVSNKKVDDSLLVLSDKEAPVVEIFSEEDDASSNSSAVAKKSKFTEIQQIITLFEEAAVSEAKKDTTSKNAVVKIKKEKMSFSGAETQMETCPTPVPIAAVAPAAPEVSEAAAETTVASLPNEVTSSIEDTLQTTTSTVDATASARPKRVRKKKEFVHKPIKEERLSDEAPVPSPVSTRTRSGSTSKLRPLSVYEDAVDKMPHEGSIKEVAEPAALPNQSDAATPSNCNETVTTNNATMMTASDATFVGNQVNSTFAMPAPAQTTFIMENNPNATVTISNDGKKPNGSLGDATFDVRDAGNRDSIMTEDDSFEKPLSKLIPVPSEIIPSSQPPVLPRTLKPKSKMNELFNPCVRSPVKKKVEAFEYAHAQASSQDMRPKPKSKQTKENAEPDLVSSKELRSNSVTTPVIGKPHAPVLGRFLTPTQQSNLTPSAGNAKKLPNSASKIMPFPTTRQMSASNLKSSSSTTSLSRENSEEDLKKGFNKLQQQAEERKKKRELKHQQAALQREAKEKERAERLKKIMKEREEKNRKKILEMEQKKRELEEINRNLKLQEEHKQATKTKLDPAEVARQERELLEQMKLQKMKMPPPPKQQTKYHFNMLHSDDSTDEEGKTSYKRPAPPLWSKTAVRSEHITCQSHLPTDVIDSFFSVQPMTPDLKAIFPNIDPRYLKRNSSAIWQTPPRYSEMPKY